MNNEAVIESFNEIARASCGGWDHNNHYHRFLLRHLPAHRGGALDIGSGLGEFARLLAERFDRVIGIDFAPSMVEGARSRSSERANITYRCADYMTEEYRESSFDCIASIAAFHHLPMRGALQRAKRSLKANGRLMILDLYRAETLLDYLAASAGTLLNLLVRIVRREDRSRELRRAWEKHGPLDRYPTIREIRGICADLLPGARVRRHLYFRYSVVWEKRA